MSGRPQARLDGTTLIIRIPMRFQRRGGRLWSVELPQTTATFHPWHALAFRSGSGIPRRLPIPKRTAGVAGIFRASPRFQNAPPEARAAKM
jgi:hypothetical protein